MWRSPLPRSKGKTSSYHSVCRSFTSFKYIVVVLFTGVLVTWLTNRFTVRSVMIVGGLLTGVGHFVSAYVLKLEMLYATYGLLTGNQI